MSENINNKINDEEIQNVTGGVDGVNVGRMKNNFGLDVPYYTCAKCGVELVADGVGYKKCTKCGKRFKF